VAEGYNQSALNPTFMAKSWRLTVAPNYTIRRIGANLICIDSGALPYVPKRHYMGGHCCVYYGTSIPYLQKHNWRQINIRASQ